MVDSATCETAMDAAITTRPAAPQFRLSPPEAVQPIEPAAAGTAMPLPPVIEVAVDEQVERFVESLLAEDVQSEGFRARLDSAFDLGRQEISIAAGLMQGRFMERNFVDLADSDAFKAIQAIRIRLDDLNPGRHGDLLKPRKLLGLIPFGNALQTYFRRYQSAGAQLNQSMKQLYAAREDMQRDVVEIDATRTRLWDGMQNLAAAIRFAERLDTLLSARLEGLKTGDPTRARALEQEVLFYTRQNLADMLTQQAVCTNGYLALDVLKKTAREMINGCSRVATTGMSALAVAQTVARATGNQVQVMQMLGGVNATVEQLVAESGRQLGQHVVATTEFAANPMIGIEKLREMFDQTFKAMDAMDTFRSQAIQVMGQNNAMLREQLERAESHLDRVRAREARAALAANDAGPVKL